METERKDGRKGRLKGEEECCSSTGRLGESAEIRPVIRARLPLGASSASRLLNGLDMNFTVPRSKNMNNLQDQGRACYKRGDYIKAVELFDRAIGRSPSVLLLDNRAACYEKLHDYHTALKDAKKAIQLHREDAVGYLRAGRVLVKMEKPTVALEIYTHGLKCIKHVGQGYEVSTKSILSEGHLGDVMC